MGDPPKTPPPFRGRTALLPQTPISPYKFDAFLSKAIPVGNFLIIRGVYERGAKKIDPVPTVILKVTELRTSNSELRDIPVHVTPLSTHDISTSCYLRLSGNLVDLDPKAEPRTDLLNLWIDPLRELGWEESSEARKKHDKVIVSMRAFFDNSGLQTVNGFRSGNGVIITFALPADVDTAIEIGYAFELVIGGLGGVDPTAVNNIISWFAAFERELKGDTALAETRFAPGERDYLIVSMKDWASTHHVLTSTNCFSKELADYNLRPPQLLFRLNTSAVWKVDPSAVINKGAKKVTGALAGLTRRFEASERDARARNADTKRTLARGFFVLSQETQYIAALGRIDASIMANQQTFTRPLDAEEKELTRVEIVRLMQERKLTQSKLDALHAAPSLITHSSPAVPPPPPAKPSDVLLSPPGLDVRSRSPDNASAVANPAKRARISPSPEEPQTAQGLVDTDDDMGVPVHDILYHPRNCLMAARCSSKDLAMKPSMRIRYTKGPDGTRSFYTTRKLKAPRTRISSTFLWLITFLFLASLVQTAAAAASFSMYALNANSLVAKLHHINNLMHARNPHSFVLSESKTNSRTGPNLPNTEYTIFEEPGVQADNHHLYKWCVALGIRKGIQVAQHVQITLTTAKTSIIGAYAPWDPGNAATRDFWPELTKLVRATSTSWTLVGDLNVTVSAAERLTGGAEARAQYLNFLAATAGHNIWMNNPDCNRRYDWTSRANGDADSGNIIDRIVTSKRSYVDAEIAADRFQDFILYTNHRAIVAKVIYTPPSGSGRTVFPTFKAILNKARIKYPARMEKFRHDDFRTDINAGLNGTGLDTAQVIDDDTFLHVYESFTAILIPAAEKCYGRVTRWISKDDNRVMSPMIERLVARLRFLGGAIRTIHDDHAGVMTYGVQLVYNQLVHTFYSDPPRRPNLSPVCHI
ncbi:hypothetical protein B0H14DRAFT_3675930 [Mycena olivaceomarginata]|nr:hypothetical protein B0H14DRAFT_3675930 [Mycena olivaceomarginata]